MTKKYLRFWVGCMIGAAVCGTVIGGVIGFDRWSISEAQRKVERLREQEAACAELESLSMQADMLINETHPTAVLWSEQTVNLKRQLAELRAELALAEHERLRLEGK